MSAADRQTTAMDTVAGKPLVSVIMPAYNAEAFIGEAIESALAQTYRPIEIIVADDGSTDGTAEATRAFGDPVRCFDQENQGPAGARNLALQHARGEYAAFLDADDRWHPQKIRLQVETMEREPDLGLLATRSGTASDINIPLPAGEVPVERVSFEALYISNHFMTSSVMARREILDEVGNFDTQFFGPEDYDMWLRLTARAASGTLQAPLAYHRDVEGGVQDNAERMRTMACRVLDKADAAWPGRITWSMRRQARSLQDQSAAWLHSMQKHQGLASVRMMQSFLKWPFCYRSGVTRYRLGRLRLVARIAGRALRGGLPVR